MSAHIVRPSSRLLRAIPAAVLVLAALLPVAGGFLRGQDQTPVPAQSTIHRANDAAVKRAADCLNQGRLQEAEYLFRQIYIVDPEDSRGPTGLAESYMAEQRPNDAIQLMKEETDKHPDRTDLRVELGNLYVRTGQDDLAMAEFQRALDTGRNLSSATTADLLFRMAEANRREGDLNAALRLFQAAAAANAKDTKALLQIALILDGTGRPEQALPIYEQILKLDPNNPIALNNLAYLKAVQGVDLDAAVDLAQKAAQKAKDSPEIKDTLGWAYLKKNQPNEAATAFRAALQAAPQNPTFHYHLGMALLQLGDRDAAKQELQTALADRPSGDDEKQIHDLLNKIAP